MKALPSHKCFKKTGVYALIAMAFMVATASETYAQTPSPTPTPFPSKKRIQVPPQIPPPYSG